MSRLNPLFIGSVCNREEIVDYLTDERLNPLFIGSVCNKRR